jgi:hypothetical protein
LASPTLAGLVNVLLQDINVVVFLNDTLNDNVVEVLTVEINDSFNNILRNADIDVLNNLLQNADINVEITDIQVVRGDVIISLLGGDVLILQ